MQVIQHTHLPEEGQHPDIRWDVKWIPFILYNKHITQLQEICEKYQIQYASQPKLHTKGLPPRHPPFERPPFRLSSPAPAANPQKDWRMPLTQYHKAAKYPEHVPTYEQSMLALSRRIRNKSLPPLPDHKDYCLSSRPGLTPTALGRHFPTRSPREDHSLFRRYYNRGSPVFGGLGYPESRERRQMTPTRGF